MRNLYFAIDIIIAVGLLSLAATSLLKQGYKNSINRLFTAFSVLVAVWIVANYVGNDVTVSTDIALYANYLVFSSSFGVVIVLMQFIVKLASARKLEILIKRTLLSLWLICVTSATPLVVAGISKQDDVYAVEFGPMVWLYAITLFFMIGVIVYGIVHGLRYSRGIRRRQLSSVSAGLAISLPLVLLLSFIVPSLTGSFSVTEFGITPIIILVISLYYGVVKYRLFDIRLAAVRTAAYILSLLTLSLAYYGIASTVSLIIFQDNVNAAVNISPINVILTLVLAFIFQPVKQFFDRITNFLFYRDVYNPEDFFTRFSRKLSTITDLHYLLTYASSEIATTLKANYGAFLIYRSEYKTTYVTVSKHKKIPLEDVRMLDKYVKNYGSGVIITDLISSDVMDRTRKLLISYKIALVLPIMQSNVVIGYLFLGDHLSSRYAGRDVKTLETIADELTIAIQNALSVQAIKELNATLQQKIDSATKELRSSNTKLQRLDEAKDEFISMASHQLRTPLTSVKGYISMVIEGDVGTINDGQKHLLGEAFTSSERMVHLINDFLNVSRLQTGKFLIDKRPVDLAKIVKQEVDSLKTVASARDLKFKYVSPKNIPMLDIDEGKIRQVIMNFADNAIYYSPEKSTIIIDLRHDKKDILFTVKDTGIGVPLAEQSQLFTKFYRASNARKQRPDGTGVGLFLAKKVIDAHGGRVVFESKPGKGSTFGFRLPLAMLKSAGNSNKLDD